MNKVSIVIPCYNDFKYIKDAINSACNQTYPDKEIIVVDDGSDTLTRNALEKLRPKIDQLILTENRGTSSARNTGIMASDGEYVLVLDADDFFHEDFVFKALDILIEDEGVKYVCSWYNRVKESRVLDVVKPIGGDISLLLKFNTGVGNGMFRKKDWKKVGGYDEEMTLGFEDWEFLIQLLKKGGILFIIPEALFNYRIKATSRTTKANEQKFNLIRFIHKKHRDMYLQHHDVFINHLLDRLEIAENNERKLLDQLEYRLGRVLLEPIKKLKRMLFR